MGQVLKPKKALVKCEDPNLDNVSSYRPTLVLVPTPNFKNDPNLVCYIIQLNCRHILCPMFGQILSWLHIMSVIRSRKKRYWPQLGNLGTNTAQLSVPSAHKTFINMRVTDCFRKLKLNVSEMRMDVKSRQAISSKVFQFADYYKRMKVHSKFIFRPIVITGQIIVIMCSNHHSIIGLGIISGRIYVHLFWVQNSTNTSPKGTYITTNIYSHCNSS